MLSNNYSLLFEVFGLGHDHEWVLDYTEPWVNVQKIY